MMCKSVVTVDYDMPEKLIPYIDVFEQYIRSRAEKLGATSVYCKTSPSGRGLHCTICFPTDLDELQRLAIEAALLDDPRRVLFNLKRILQYGVMVDILFAAKWRLRRDPL